MKAEKKKELKIKLIREIYLEIKNEQKKRRSR